jgi:hypothetical protein
VVAALLGCQVASVERIPGGRNSRVYRVTTSDAQTLVAKFYAESEPGDRDRLDAEWSALRFLWEHEVACVPAPVACDRIQRCAVYSYIDGQKIQPSDVTAADVTASVEFLARLKKLSQELPRPELPLASEACLSAEMLAGQIDQRLAHLKSICIDHPELADYVDREFQPCLQEATTRCQTFFSTHGFPWNTEIPWSQRTLTPSDFGFHNALRRPNGEIVFLDFEHFGWDDPAKTICDFFLHPEMDLGDSLKKQFLSQAVELFADQPALWSRVQMFYPLFALKWCLILLNEFVPQAIIRRGFAQTDTLDRPSRQAQQLAKSRQLLRGLLDGSLNVPFYG